MSGAHVALRHITELYGLPYLPVHMAVFNFHACVNRYLRRLPDAQEPFPVRAPELVWLGYTLGELPDVMRREPNLLWLLYALLTLYFVYWEADFIPLRVRRLARMLGVAPREQRRRFERLVLYLSTHHTKGLQGVARDTPAYRAWEHFLRAH